MEFISHQGLAFQRSIGLPYHGRIARLRRRGRRRHADGEKNLRRRRSAMAHEEGVGLLFVLRRGFIGARLGLLGWFR